MNRDPGLYRPNAGVMLINKQGLVWAGERAAIAGAWQMPQGGIDNGEPPEGAAARELTEETGIPPRDVRLLAEHPDWLFYDFPPEGQRPDDIFLGQRQKWFLFEYLGEDAAIDLKKAAHNEFSNWRWMPTHKLLKTVVDFRRPVYEQVFSYFTPLIP